MLGRKIKIIIINNNNNKPNHKQNNNKRKTQKTISKILLGKKGRMNKQGYKTFINILLPYPRFDAFNSRTISIAPFVTTARGKTHPPFFRATTSLPAPK